MQSIIRYFLLLALCGVTFLIVLGSLLFSHYESTRGLERVSHELLAPSREHILSALLELQAVDRHLQSAQRADGEPAAVPLRIRVEASLEAIDSQLDAAARLGAEFGRGDRFGLAARAASELAALRGAADRQRRIDARAARALSDDVELLRSTLLQLDRVNELAQRQQRQAIRQGRAAATRSVLMATGALVVIAVPLIALLAFQLRAALRREARSRRDLAEANQNLQSMAHYDGLTGLGNRHLFRARLEQTAAQARRDGKLAALMYLDLDHFKRINDSLGHDIGDQVLTLLGKRLQEAVRESDTVARLGGDEFTVILSDIPDADTAGVIAEKLLACIHEPLALGARELVLSASIGITLLPADGVDPTTLMKNADLALYKSKESGRHGFQFFVDEMNRKVVAHMRLEAEMRQALSDEAFELHYQPQLSLADGQVECLEALLRWTRADGSAVAPVDFIAVAEHTGLMQQLGVWVLRRACADAALLNRRRGPPLRVAVNLSARQLNDRDLVAIVADALQSSGLDGRLLELEITETTLVEHMESAASTLSALRALGARVAIDDFGVGYSSLTYLKRLPVDRIKIDRAFVRDIERDEADRSLVATMVAMAQGMSLGVVAEGVETEWQLRHLAELGCGAAQGYLLCRPMPMDQLSPAQVQSDFRRLGLNSPGGLRAVDTL